MATNRLTEAGLADRAGPIRAGEELDLPRLEACLRDQLPHTPARPSHQPDAPARDHGGDTLAGASGWHGPLVVQQFPAGHSNLTYLLALGDRELVLRRPPFGNPVKSAHDMGREYRVLSRLCEVYPPAPRPYLYCQDKLVIGDEFYVMERRRGVVLRDDHVPDRLRNSPETVRRLCESFVDNLVRLHTLDYRAAGLADLGKPEGYVERQVAGWIKRYDAARTDDYPAVEQIGRWLADHRPPDAGRAGIVHNDYKYDNLMLADDELTRIVAVFDWEMATLGDPLMDLGTTLAYWVQPGDSASQVQQAFGPTTLPGSFTRREVVERYSRQTGVDVPNVLFYYAFGLYKLAVIVQQIYARYVRGLTHDPRFAEMNQRVESLGRAGVQAIESGDI